MSMNRSSSMKTNLIVILIFLFPRLAMSQNGNLNYKNSLKFYNLSTYQSSTVKTNDSSGSTSIRNKSLKILSPTFAFNWKGKRNNFNELELTSLALNKHFDETTVSNSNSPVQNSPIGGAKIVSSIISVRYEYIVNLTKGLKSKFIPSLGYSINPYFRQSRITPLTSQSFPTTIVNTGGNGYLIPRISYYFSSKCFFDINIPIEVFSLNNSMKTVRNPQIEVKNQRTSVWNFELFPQEFSLRLGIGIKI